MSLRLGPPLPVQHSHACALLVCGCCRFVAPETYGSACVLSLLPSGKSRALPPGRLHCSGLPSHMGGLDRDAVSAVPAVGVFCRTLHKQMGKSRLGV